MFGWRGGGEDVADLPAFEHHGVGDEGAMATPGDGFCAHDGGWGGRGDLREFGEAFGELRGGHVIGVTAERRVAPAGVDGIFAAVTAAAEGFQMRVSDAGCVERGCQFFGVELGDVAGFGDGADVHEMADAVGVEEGDELFNGVGGVADGVEDSLRHASMVAIF